MGKSPAFQFYVNDWLGSANIMLMTPAEEGAYVRLLAIAWGQDDCGLPDDDIQLATLSRLCEGWLNGSGQKIKKCFIKKGDRLYNKRLLDEKKKQAEWIEKSREGGRKSGEARRNPAFGKALADKRWMRRVVEPPCEPNANRMVEPNANSSSSSSSKEKIYIEKKVLGEFQNVLLSEEESLKLTKKFGEQGAKERIEGLSAGVASKGYKYKSHYATIFSWERKHQKESGKTW